MSVSPSKRGDIDALLRSSALTPAKRVAASASKNAPQAMEPELSGLSRLWEHNRSERDRVVPLFGPSVRDAISLAILAALSGES